MFSLFGSASLSPDDTRRLRRIEAKLDLILANLGLQYDEPPYRGSLSAEVRRLADDGQKIEAIKEHRRETGMGLKESKEAVEEYLGGG